MATLTHSDSNKKYSWWWDSHNSPKNSKWLQENLTDMDVKVKQMIKLIEEDADSFARRAEMYYKKRPELMKLVEEFYRAYRALAERYDHANGVIRQAHRTMAEAFPNQVPPVPADDLHTVPSMENEQPHTPYSTRHSHAFSDSDELQKGLKQLNDLFMTGESASHVNFGEGRARRGLNFLDTEETTGLKNVSHDTENRVLSDSERMTKTETEILALKIALARLESEKEDGLIQYQQSLERLSNLESEMSRARENSQGLDDRASKAEAEVQTLKETLAELHAERENNILQYQQCLEKICDLEKNISSAQKDIGELNERATGAETEAEFLKADLVSLDAQKEAVLFQYNQSLETLSKLEEELVQAEENAKKTSEQANIAKNEIEDMKLKIVKLTKENEDAALRFQQCLEIISSLEHKLSCAEEEVRELNCKINDGAEKLNISEQKCLLLETSNQTLESELQSLVQKMGSQSEELSEKQKELGRLWTSIQEERLRFIEAETAFQTLQNLHAQSQEELRSLASEHHNKLEILETMESHKQALEDEVHKAKEENKILNDLKLSSSVSINNLQSEMLNLRETIKKLELEVGLRVDERNALQQEIYCLKAELHDVNKRHESTIEEVRSTGLDPQCFSLSVKTLQDENSKLKETCEADKGENTALKKKLEIMEKLLEKNAALENSLSVLNAELESVRGRVKVLEETCESLLEEKSTLAAEKATLFFQLQTTAEKLEKISEKNLLLENSLFDVNAELEALRVKSNISEETCLLLDHEKSSLTSEKETLDSQLNMTRQTLKNLEKQHSELELQHLELKAEKESALQKVEDLLVSLYAEREERSRTVQLNDGHLVEKEFQIHILQEDASYQKKEYEEELDRAVHAQMQIFILQKCIRDMEQSNLSLLVESQRLLEASKTSDRVMSKLENDNVQKQVDANLLSEKINILRIGLLQVLKTLDINSNHLSEDNVEEDQELLNHIPDKLQETQNSFVTVFHENQQAAIENSVLVSFLDQLKLKAENLVTEREALDMELRTMSNQYLALQEEVRMMAEKNQELKLTISKGEEKMEAMTTEKLMALNALSKEMDKLVSVNVDLEERLKIVIGKLEDVQMENIYLKESFVVSNTEQKLIESVNDQLNSQIRNGKELLSQKESEILGAAEMYSALQDEKKALQKLVEDLKSKYEAAKVIIEDRASQILELSSNNDHQNEELGCLHEVNKNLEAEMRHLHQELGETKLREKKLSFALLKGADDLEQWESQAATFYTAMQISTVNETFFEGKVRELADACENLEYINSSKVMESEKLEERVNKLEAENRRLQSQMASYVPAISVLNDCITSLEMQTHVHAKPHSHDYKESKIKNLANVKYADGDPRKSEDRNATETDALPDFQDMQKRVNAIEMAVKQMNENFKPKDEMREIRVLKSGISWRQGNAQTSKHYTQMDEVKEHQFGAVYGHRTGKSLQDVPVAEIEVLPKDIMLDHTHGRSRRGARGGSDDQMLELWETADKDGVIGLRVGKAQKDAAPTGYHQRRHSKDSKNKYPSIDSLIEKELSVDKLEISRRQSQDSQPLLNEGNKRKVLERLDSDAQKLMNLEITVQDLINKMEIIEKNTMGKGIEYNAVKGQLESAQEAITKLFDANRKLMTNVEEGTPSFSGKSVTVSDESGSVNRRKVSEQARRGSEKIGRLQLEVQRLQFLLLKLNDDKDGKGKGKAMIDDQNPRVLLRDYLYGETRTSYHKRKKKTSFCGCMQPPTKGD
ncbi:kinase interacting (KIP1-like) family protein [Trifolium pratense]|uniref:Kinase interacting (KIP1-like) family protein n=2 Tax=Trifolium TaxID=3898 RepID=A0A2K3NUK8_TRIPR|nr:kinase interacting (KIP1-like) family protein [Trifolium pratense]PNY06971.1 kinase interacting (KIP1-like) family protein [Trifolium pratense]PNY07158.1 kinase interacting (KIP1-like) family protein [Trifolium pratense]